jgi:hypothetical protein
VIRFPLALCCTAQHTHMPMTCSPCSSLHFRTAPYTPSTRSHSLAPKRAGDALPLLVAALPHSAAACAALSSAPMGEGIGSEDREGARRQRQRSARRAEIAAAAVSTLLRKQCFLESSPTPGGDSAAQSREGAAVARRTAAVAAADVAGPPLLACLSAGPSAAMRLHAARGLAALLAATATPTDCVSAGGVDGVAAIQLHDSVGYLAEATRELLGAYVADLSTSAREPY